MVVAHVAEVGVPGGRVSFVEVGDPGGRTVVALSGLSDGLAPVTDERARDALPELPEKLRALRLLVFSYREDMPPSITTELLAADMASAIEQVCDPPVALTGHSMGGMVAQHVVAERPDLVDRLLLSATTARAGEQLRAVLDRWDGLVTSQRFRAFYRDAIDTSFTGAGRWRRRLLLRLGQAPDASDRIDRHLALSNACRQHDSRHVLDRIACPTLVLAGELDPVVPLAATSQLARALPDARFASFPGMAHGFPEQAWQRYVRTLVDFVATERTEA